MKKKLTTVLSVVLIAVVIISGTLAYLTSTDSDVNVMTLGNVKIEQIEQERVEQSDKNTAATNLTKFQNNKPLYPSVYEGQYADWARDDSGKQVYQAFPTGGSSAMWTDTAKNAIDKIVFVENTGKSSAYVRTWFAFEQGSLDQTRFEAVIGRNINDTHWTWEDVAYGVEIDGNTYAIFLATYTGNAGANKDEHKNGVLAPGQTTRPSLLQVMMYNSGTNEDVKAIDGNEDGKYDILVVSQGVQTEGFATADEALDKAFGDGNVDNHPFKGVKTAHEKNTWDGTADTSWYNDTDTEFTLMTAEELAGLAELVDEGNSFEGKTVKLGNDIDLYCLGEDKEQVSFDPIGDKSAFKGTFDGQGHTIENLYQSGWDFGYEWGSYGSIGLFGELKDATIKNLKIKGAESLVEGGDIGGITGSATGDCTFENITISDSVFATYNNGNGGIIGWSGAGTYNFKNITIEDDVVLAGLWGSFDSSIGGIVGQGEPGATYNFENVDIACRLDVYNDCTASYDYYNYRMCGMIIGRLQKTTTIDGTNYPDTSQYNITCDNVTVTYGEWANYHYCDPTPGYNNGRGMRVEAGYSYDGLPEDYDHTQCTTHHNELIAFDQIFGGAQLGVKGLPSYDGVTVIYNNK